MVEDDGTIHFHKHMLAEDVVAFEVWQSWILVVTNMKISVPKSMELNSYWDHENQEKFFVNCMVILLGFRHFTIPICIRCIVGWLRHPFCHHKHPYIYGMVLCGSSMPWGHLQPRWFSLFWWLEGLLSRFVRHWLKQMYLFRSHKLVSVDSTKDTVHFIDYDDSHSRMVEMYLFQGLRPVGDIQNPIQAVSCTVEGVSWSRLYWVLIHFVPDFG